MTYREAVQIQIAALMKIYDNAEGLRDAAGSHEEKTHWNHLRRDLPAVWQSLQKLDNTISDNQAQYQLRGNYAVKIEE